MIEKRKCAQRSRSSGSVTGVKEISQTCGARRATTGSPAYRALMGLTIGMFCGCLAPRTQRDQPDRDRREKYQQALQGLKGSAGKSCKQTGGQ